VPFKLLNLGQTLLCLVPNDAYFRALSSGTNNSKTQTYDLFPREGIILSLSGAYQEDSAASTSVRHAGLSQARRLADARPKLSRRRSSSTVLSQVCLGLPVLRRQSLGGPRMQAWRASVGIAGGVGGVQPPQFISSTPPVRFICLSWGGQKITPQITLVYTVCEYLCMTYLVPLCYMQYSVSCIIISHCGLSINILVVLYLYPYRIA